MLMCTAYRGSHMLQIYMHAYCIYMHKSKHILSSASTHVHHRQNCTHTINYCILLSLFSSCAQEDSWMLFCFDHSIDFKVLRHCGESHFLDPVFFTPHQNRYTCFKSTRLLLCCASVWLNPAVWKQGALPEHTCPLNSWTARLAPITVPQCIISKWTDLYIKIQTTTYSGQAPLKASALRWIKRSDRMMDNPHLRAGPDSVR